MADSTPAPTGPFITLVFTDIEGSTGLWETHGRKFQECLELHNEVLRTVLHRHNGYEVKTEGDAFMIAFASVVDAIHFCMESQESLNAAPWPDYLTAHQARSNSPSPSDNRSGLLVRMAVHTGDPTVKINPLTQRADYFGPTVNRAARLCAAAHGGQVLISSKSLELTWDYLENQLNLPGQLTDLGHHALRGLSAPEHIWQLLPSELAEKGDRFPRLRTPNIDRHNLPDELTQFVGRETELQQIALRHEQGERVITLLGAGGTGKTRLAIHFGRLQVEALKGGVWIADLTDAKTTDDVCSAVAKALDLPLTTKNSVGQVGEAIAAKGDVMLILDNFEQVVAAAPETVAVWASLAPKARFLVTSRQVLWIRGEQLLAVDPLPIPPQDLPESVPESALNEIAQYDAVALFCIRATQVDPNFQLDLNNASHIVNIVRYLDGIPLALELAASRVRMMHPKQLFQRIQHRMDVLRGPTKTGAERQATLRGAIDWSWRTLEPWEQAALCRCSIFRGGFNLEAGEQLLEFTSWPEAPDPIDLVQALYDKSLLFRVRSDDDTTVRFSMYRSIRSYAEDKLHAVGAITGEANRNLSGPEAHAEALNAHGAYFASLAEEALSKNSIGPLRTLSPDLENLLKAATHGAQHQEVQIAASSGLAALQILRLQGPFTSMVELSDAVLRVEDLMIEARMRILEARGEALRIIGNSVAAQAAFEQALDLAYRVKNHRFEATVRINLSVLCRQLGRMDGARNHGEKALELALSVGDRALAARVLSNLGRHHQERGEVETARRYFHQATEHLTAINRPLLNAVTSLNIAEIDHIQGQLDQAEDAFIEAERIFENEGDRVHQCIAHILLARLRSDNRDFQSANDRFDAALRLSRAMGNRRFEGLALTGLADVSIQTHRIEDAAKLIANALPILEEVGDPTAEGSAWGVQAEIQSLRKETAEAASSIAHGEALLRDVGNQHRLGVLLCRRARIELRSGAKAVASRAAHEAALIAEQLALQPRAPLQKHIQILRIRLGEPELRTS